MFPCDEIQIMLSWLECYIAMLRSSQDVVFESHNILLFPGDVNFDLLARWC